MSEQPEDMPPSREPRNAWARVEAKLDVYIAAMGGWKDGVDRRLADHDALHQSTTQALAQLQQEQTALKVAEATRQQEKAPKTSPAQWIALAISAGVNLLLVVYLILDHAPGQPG